MYTLTYTYGLDTTADMTCSSSALLTVAISNFNAADFGVEKFSDYFSPYATVKFRPANGETLDYKSGNPTSICMMRVEEMILTEIEALAYTNPAEAAAITPATTPPASKYH